jgi:hypothetical protein
VAESTFSELDFGLLSDKRIGASCAILGLKNGSRVPVIVGGKSSEVSPLQTSHKMSQIEIFDPQMKVWTLMSQPIPVITDHVRKIVLESFNFSGFRFSLKLPVIEQFFLVQSDL